MRLWDLLSNTLIMCGSGSPDITEGKIQNLKKKYDCGNWNLERDYDHGPCVKSLTFKKTHHEYDVCEIIRWISPVRISFTTKSGVEIKIAEFPLTNDYIISDSELSRGGIVQKNDLWLDGLFIQDGFQLVYGFEFSDNSHTPVPFTKLENRSYEDFSESASATEVSASEKAGRMTTIKVVKPRFLICVSFICCGPDYEFEPESIMNAARIFPTFMIKSNSAVAEIESITAEIDLARKNTASHKHDEMSDFRTASLFADRNLKPGPLEPNPPMWNVIFDYYKIWDIASAFREDFLLVDQSRRLPRVNGDLRSVINTTTLNPFAIPLTVAFEDVYTKTSVMKLPGQSGYDNIHIAPFMKFGTEDVVMAPICEHDCLHTHVRWGAALSDKRWVRGWQGDLPFQKLGNPLVPENQTIRMNVFRGEGLVGFRYQARVKNAKPRQWQIIFHHGAGYGIEINFEKVKKIMSWWDKAKDIFEDITPTDSNIEIGNAAFYYYLRYAMFPKTSKYFPRIKEENFSKLERL